LASSLCYGSLRLDLLDLLARDVDSVDIVDFVDLIDFSRLRRLDFVVDFEDFIGENIRLC